jgi:hypothetical protein
VTETRHYHNEATQAEKREVLRDTLLARAQSDADLTSQGRFKREITTRVTGVPSYPQLPPSSPWANGFDQNLEPPFGVDVEAHAPVGTHAEIEASIPTLKPPEVHALPAAVEDRVGEPDGTPPLIPSGSHSMKRRSW